MTLAPSTRSSLLVRLGDVRDHKAWVEFVTLYEPVVYRLLRQRGLQDVDARDLMQELFLAVSRNIDRWKPTHERGSFRAWLRCVARNLVINWLKSRQRRVLSGGPELNALLDQLPAAGEQETVEFDRELERALFQRAAQRVQTEVQPATWQAFWETSITGLSTGEVAGKLGMSVGAVWVAKCRVVARIKTAVAEMEKSI
jgi:RNA polymerase sigma-70 factor (ECF subfamily)